MTRTRKPIYAIRISEETRNKLDEIAKRHSIERLIKEYGANNIPTVARRTSLSTYFHKKYIDNRPQVLKDARVWSLNERKILTDISLSDVQVAAVLYLAKKQDIDPQPHKGLYAPERGALTYLLATFLEAVIEGHLVEENEH